MFGNGDESIGDSSQHSVEPSNAVGPACRVQCRENHRNAGASSSQTTPKHFVSGTDGDDSINFVLLEQFPKSSGDGDIVFMVDEMVKNRNFIGQLFAEDALFLKATNHRLDSRFVETTRQVD